MEVEALRPKKKKPGHQVEQLPEPRVEFCKERERVLLLLDSEARDKSRAGGVDAAIVSFVRSVNEVSHSQVCSVFSFSPETPLVHRFKLCGKIDRDSERGLAERLRGASGGAA